MHFCVKFIFKDNSVNNEIDMSVWKYLPDTCKIGTFFSSGNTWIETKKDYYVEVFSTMLQDAISCVFSHYKREDMFGYVESGYQEFLTNQRMFTLSVFEPDGTTVAKIKKLKRDICSTEEHLHDLKAECRDLFRKLQSEVATPTL